MGAAEAFVYTEPLPLPRTQVLLRTCRRYLETTSRCQALQFQEWGREIQRRTK